jgi:hypothetical protein
MKCLPHRQTATRDHGRFIRRMPVTVYDDDLVAKRGAEAGVLVAVDAHVGTHVIAAADFRPPVTKPGPIGGHAAAHNSDQASARLESQEGLLDVNSRIDAGLTAPLLLMSRSSSRTCWFLLSVSSARVAFAARD